MTIKERSWKDSSFNYRFGFNGQEGDKEINGDGNSYAFKYRIHDPRLGRFLSFDPLATKFPYYSVYQFAGNKPIRCIDIEGAENLDYKETNKYGEKKTHLVKTNQTVVYEYHWVEYVSVEVNPAGHAISETLSEVEMYNFAIKRLFDPGSNLISEEQYLDKSFLKIEEQVQYFFGNNVPTYSTSKYATEIIYFEVISAISSGDETQKSQAIQQIKNSDNFLYRHALADIIPWGATPRSLVKNVQSAMKSLAKIEARQAKIVANAYKAEWANADLKQVINKFAGENAKVSTSSTGKIMWTNEKTGMRVVQDPLNKYFRIENTKLTGNRKYLDLDGAVPNNKTIGGKQIGRTKNEYDKVTHFNYD